MKEKEQRGNDKFLTRNRRTQAVIDMLMRAAQTDTTILINGESGVGKSYLAKHVHYSSSRRQAPFVQINCAALPESLIESELFGYEPGAFTGADQKGKAGLLEVASAGTVFLDEIAELPMHLQTKLLGVVQDKEFFRIGGRQTVATDIRFITATNKNLEEMIQKNLFREDLYYRLNVVPVTLPPLRARREDIPDLIDYFCAKYNRRHSQDKVFSESLIRNLAELQWKGNIRELENFVERNIVITAEDVISHDNVNLPGVDVHNYETPSLKEILEEREREILISAKAKYRTTRKIAEVLKISQPSVSRKLRSLSESHCV